jgi:hypothetical protein
MNWWKPILKWAGKKLLEAAASEAIKKANTSKKK